MTPKNYWPAIDIRDYGSKCMTTAAVRLASLQSVRLRRKRREPVSENEKMFTYHPYHIHLPLLHALAKMPSDVFFHLNLLTYPYPAYPLSGKVEMAILISSTGENRQDVVSELLARYVNLFSLLSTFLPHAEFEVVRDDIELKKWLNPFMPTSAFAIDRYEDAFSLTVDPDANHSNSIGFLTSVQKKEEIPAIRYLFPWFQNGLYDYSHIIEALLLYPSPIWFQVRLQPAKLNLQEITGLKEAFFICEELLTTTRMNMSILSVQANELRSAITERLWLQNRPVFRGGCYLCSTAELDEALAGAVAGQISPPPLSKGQSAPALRGGHTLVRIAVDDFLDPTFTSPLGVITAEEAACAFRIPYAFEKDPPGLPVKYFKTGLVDSKILQNTQEGMLLLGYNRHRGHINPVRVTCDDRMRHTCIMGQTGTGKTVLLESMILQDIKMGRGCCFIDPHGDSIENILHEYPEERTDDLVLVDFLDRQRVVPFNLLAWRDEEERDKIIDDLYGWLDITYDMKVAGGPIFELYFRSFLRLLMGDHPDAQFIPVISDFIRIFVDRKFRKFCLGQSSDPQVKRKIKQANEAGGEAKLENIAPYITSKLNRFDSDKNLQLMTSQERMAVNFEEIMNSGKVMLVNLGRGRFGETLSGLLASQIVSRFQSAAMKRINMAAEKRRDFFLYIDEFQNVASEPFISMLAETRKFRLGLILANQYADQLAKKTISSGDSVLKAVLGNVGNTTCFRLGIHDANTMESAFLPDFSKEDLVNLPLGNCYINLKSRLSSPSIFSLETSYVEYSKNQKHVQKLRDVSLEKFSIPVAVAENNLVLRNERLDEICCGQDIMFHST